MRRLILAAFAIVVVAVVCWAMLSRTQVPSELGYVVRHASLGSAYVASELCYGVLLQGRTEESVRASELGPWVDDRLSWYRTRVDDERREVRAALVGLFRQQWGQRADGSCSRGLPGEAAASLVANAPDPRPWPAGDALHPGARTLVPHHAALVRAVAEEFRPFDSGRDRGTRSVLVIHRGHLVHEHHAPGWNRLIPQNGHSNTKVLNAILAGVLVGQGKLSVEDEALRPDWTDERASIRFHHLLHMESGLAWEESSGVDDSGYAKLIASSASDYAAEKALIFAPGDRFNYSGGDSELAISVLQRRSGLDVEAWARYPHEVLFRPLGMTRTVLARTASGEIIAQGSMYAAAVDWARLGLFLARDGVWDGERILPEGWVDFMATPTDASGCNYGAQLWIRGGCTEGSAAPVFELSGFMGQGVVVVPGSETIIVRLGFGPWIMGDLLERVLPALGVDAPTRMAMEVDG